MKGMVSQAKKKRPGICLPCLVCFPLTRLERVIYHRNLFLLYSVVESRGEVGGNPSSTTSYLCVPSFLTSLGLSFPIFQVGKTNTYFLKML